MEYIKSFRNHKESLESKIDENQNSDDFPKEIKNQNDIKNWVKWSQNNTTNKEDMKLTMDFLNHYLYSKNIEDQNKQMTE